MERKDVSSELAVFKFIPSETIPFTAGQFATLGLMIEDRIVERPYSIVSSPLEKYLEFFIELVPNGRFTRHLWELKPGSTILIRRRAAGSLKLLKSSQKHLMVATVTGVAPFVSILRTHELRPNAADSNQLVLIHSASSSLEFGPYLHELQRLAGHGQVTYIPTISRAWNEVDWHGEIGRAEDVVRKYTDSLDLTPSNSNAYLCGHPKMVENVKGVLTRARFLEDQIMGEDYFALHSQLARRPPDQQTPIGIGMR